MTAAAVPVAYEAVPLHYLGRAVIPIPTGRLALVVAASAPVWMLPSRIGAGLAILVLLGVLAAVLAELIISPGPGSLTVTRRLPATLGLGEHAEADYSVGSSWPRAVLVRVVDLLPAGLRADPGPPRELRAERFGVATTATPFAAVARGRYELGTVALLVTGRFGLTQRWFHYGDGAKIVIAPSIVAARSFRLQALQARTAKTGERSLRRRGESLSFAGLRAYARGDDPRLIDWKATARQRAPMVKEFALEQGQTVLIALDAGRMMTQIEDHRPRFEFALSSALVLAAVAGDGGDHVGLLLFDDTIRAYVPPAKGISAVSRIREVLVGAQPSLVEPDYAAAFAAIASRLRRRALIVLFTDVIDPRSSRALVMHAAAGMRRHLPLVVALRNESLARAALPRAASPGQAAGRTQLTAAARDVYRSAAAEELLLARAATLEQMRQSGATVLDVRPTAMTAAVINRYLDLKARGSL